MKLFLRTFLLACVCGAIAAPAAMGQANPYANYTCSPGPADCSGWRNADVTLQWFLAVPPVQDQENCPQVEPIRDEGVTRWTCSVLVNNQWLSKTAVVSVDKTAPRLPTGVPSRPPDANGWYRGGVRVRFVSNDSQPGVEVSGIAECTSAEYVGPDTSGTAIAGRCRDNAGNVSGTGNFSLRFDATPPAVATVTPLRKPDHGRWYTRPVGFAVSGSDRLSGLAGCPPVVFDGAASETAVVHGHCRDLAGNVGTRAVTIPYDASAPALRKVKVRPGDEVVRLNWAAADASKVRVVRSPGRGGDERTELHDGPGDRLVDKHVRNGKRYRYRFSAVDQAGNESARTVSVVPGPRLLSPSRGARVGKPPMLRWTPVRGADYYNVQLWRGRTKVLSTWPSKAKLRLKYRWKYLGKRRLKAGEYRWIVWPGEGPRALNDYGTLIGRRTFVYAPDAG